MIGPPPPYEPERPPVIMDLTDWEEMVREAPISESIWFEGSVRFRQIKHPRQGTITGISVGNAVLLVHGTIIDRRDLRRLPSWTTVFSS